MARLQHPAVDDALSQLVWIRCVTVANRVVHGLTGCMQTSSTAEGVGMHRELRVSAGISHGSAMGTSDACSLPRTAVVCEGC